jgi:sterol desaturase/sphingolipid hydroxylase (fatty acid hydroxylase superfamily)
MSTTLTMVGNHPDEFRLVVFVGLLVIFLAAESLRPFNAAGSASRRLTNLGLSALGLLVLRLSVPLLYAAWSALTLQAFPGVLDLLAAPSWLKGGLSIVLLDAAIYFQHRAMHAWPVLWRLHRVHHLDTSVDVTTGVRFHPLELLVSLAWKLAVISVLGVEPLWVLIYEAVLSSFALWTHANIALTPGMDTRMRWLIATPNMHRVHHSTCRSETDSNYANFLTVWDRLFGTYRAPLDEPPALGLPDGRDQRDQGFLTLLAHPFRVTATRIRLSPNS